MYCSVCGYEIKDDAHFCPHCGTAVQYIKTDEEKTNVIAVVGFVFSFIIGIVGLICSIIGYRNADSLYNGKYKRLALSGVLISEITITWQITFATFMGTLLLIVLS